MANVHCVGAAGQIIDVLAALGVLLLGILLCLIGSGLMGQLKDASMQRQEPGVEELLGVAAAVAGAGIVAWWILSLACAAVTTILDRKGRTRAAAATRRLSPAFMQRLVLGALSVQLLSGPAAHAAVTGPGPGWAPTQETVSSVPVVPGTQGSAAREGDAIEAHPPSTFHPGWQPAAPVIDPGMLAAPAIRVPALEGPPDEGVAVQAGDTLWDIAARHLGPGVSDLDIALQWPRWYDANRGVIGQDPDVLLPGQILQPPPPGRK